uniref:TLC domain-containing protein n=1 Tax=Magallana gigas TaxID=29159 RepID=A0A8W8MNV8_MAGGI
MASAEDNTELTSIGSDDVDHRIAFLVVVFSVVFFRISNLIVAKFIEPPPSAINDPWRWRNLFVSWIHAILCGCWDIICFAVYPEMFDDLSAHINYFTYTLVAFSTGYFTYDVLDMYFNNRLLHDWGVTLHHLIVLIFFVYNIQTKYAIELTCVALLVEVNGMFLHARKLMQIFQYGFEHKMYIVNKYTNLITFVVCRGYPIEMMEDPAAHINVYTYNTLAFSTGTNCPCL